MLGSGGHKVVRRFPNGAGAGSVEAKLVAGGEAEEEQRGRYFVGAGAVDDPGAGMSRGAA